MKSLARLAPAFACALVLTAAAAFAQEAPVPRDLPRLEAPPASPALDAPAVEGQEPRRVARFGRPIVRIGQDHTLMAGEDVRHVFAAFGDLTVAGSVNEDVVVVFGTVHLAASAIVRGSVIVVGGSAAINEGAVVDRDLVVLGGTLTAPAGFAPGGDHVVVGSQALGNTLGAFAPWLTRGLLFGRLIVPDLGWVWVVFGLAFLVDPRREHAVRGAGPRLSRDARGEACYRVSCRPPGPGAHRAGDHDPGRHGGRSGRRAVPARRDGSRRRDREGGRGTGDRQWCLATDVS